MNGVQKTAVACSVAADQPSYLDCLDVLVTWRLCSGLGCSVTGMAFQKLC